jgi:hypothetical protein
MQELFNECNKYKTVAILQSLAEIQFHAVNSNSVKHKEE